MERGRSSITPLSGSGSPGRARSQRSRRRARSSRRGARYRRARARRRARRRPSGSRAWRAWRHLRQHRPPRYPSRRASCAAPPSEAPAPVAGPVPAAPRASPLRARLLELFHQLALLLRQLLRHRQLHAREDVAATRALQPGGAFALHAQKGPVEGAGLDLHGHRTVRRRHLDLRPERGLRERHRHVDDQVVAAARERLRRLDTGDHEQVARLRAAVAGFALATQADSRAVLDAGRDLHRVALRPPFAAGAAALRARILDHRPVPAAARARLREREQALRLGLDAAALALGAERRRGPGLRAGAAALAARGLELDRDLRLDAVQRVLEREVDLDLEVAPALAALLLPAAAAAPEEPAEDVAEVAYVEALGGEVESPSRPSAPVGGAEAVVLLALLLVREDV